MTKPLPPLTDSPHIPKPGDAVALVAVVPQIVVRERPDHHGLLVTGAGEIALMIGGNGFKAKLPSQLWQALAHLAGQMAHQVAAQEEITRARADAALEKVVADHPLHALPPERFGNA